MRSVVPIRSKDEVREFSNKQDNETTEGLTEFSKEMKSTLSKRRHVGTELFWEMNLLILSIWLLMLALLVLLGLLANSWIISFTVFSSTQLLLIFYKKINMHTYSSLEWLRIAFLSIIFSKQPFLPLILLKDKIYVTM